MNNTQANDAVEGVAIIGMSGRFPGADNLAAFWRNLRGGVESISFFSPEELRARGVNPQWAEAPNYVPASGVLSDPEKFDASFFGFSPREAEIMDPQLRLFLECAWEALEGAGYAAGDPEYSVGVYAGMNMGAYLLNNILPDRRLMASTSQLQLRIFNDKDFLAPLAAYKLDLRGPSVSVQTACSTSLVAACMASQSLLAYQCDMALAGGVSVSVPQTSGYFAHEGVFSPDGHCRAFDAAGQGTVYGSGVGVVLLKRLEDALADGDTIHAVIRGAALNNDGASKVGFTAPSVSGQMEVIAMAQAVAGVSPDSIGYVEAHGTGTPLGDPIEVAALTQAFRLGTERKNFCALGSVKSNVGHLDAAAGVASLIKTVLALKHGELPPSLHFERPNPHIDFASSPFYVNTGLAPWRRGETPRRAGISAFAVGGTNAHVILEESPEAEPSGDSRPWQLLVLSAQTPAALEAATDNLVRHLEEDPGQHLADAAYTLQVGRRAFRHRRTLVARDAREAAAALAGRDPRRVLTGAHDTSERPVAFMFPGLSDQYVGMTRELYREEPVFAEHLDHCAEALRPHLKLDIRELLYAGEAPAAGGASAGRPDLRRMLGRDAAPDEAAQRLGQTQVLQPIFFAVEYSLAQLWLSWGIRPQAMVGYSIGEYVAACLAGVFSLDDALALVARRAQIIQQLPGGSMLAVSLSEDEVRPHLGAKLDLAAVNGPAACVVAGPAEAVANLEEELTRKGVATRRLQTTHAFHSRMMNPVVESFREMVARVRLSPPEIPYLSNVTGTWVTDAQATDPGYWAGHLAQTVRFGDSVRELWKAPDRVLLEVGPGQGLGAWALQHPDSANAPGRVVLSSIRHAYEDHSDVSHLLNSLGKLWLAGLRVDWKGFYARERRRRVSLPTYPFERQRYWVEPQAGTPEAEAAAAPPAGRQDLADWFYVPVWKQTPACAPYEGDAAGRWLVFIDESGLGARLAERLRRDGGEVTEVSAGEGFAAHGEDSFTLNPRRAEEYAALLDELRARKRMPERVVHLWGVTSDGEAHAGAAQERGFYSLLFLAQELGNRNFSDPLRLDLITSHVQQVTGDDDVLAEKATVLGPCRVLPQEYPNVTCRSIDVAPPTDERRRLRLTEQLLAELSAVSDEPTVAYRGARRWAQGFERAPLGGVAGARPRLRTGGVYLITGGLGGVGRVLAGHLAREAGARLVLVGRTALPSRAEWGGWLETHDEDDATSRHVRSLLSLEGLGAEVLYLTADVTSEEQMRGVVAEAAAKFGTVHGAIHAAGVSPGGLIQLKARETAAAVLAPKVSGTPVLEEALRGFDLDFLLLCSSLTAVTGGIGLVDHSAANAFLDAYAQGAAADGRTHVMSVNWDEWLEVGQAADAQRSGERIESLRDLFDGEAAHPLLGRRLAPTPEGDVYVKEFDASEQWVLDDHRVLGSGMAPGTAYLEMVRAAFETHARGRVSQMQKVLFLSPLIVPDGETREVQTVIRQEGAAFNFVIRSRAGEARWQEHVKGKLVALDAPHDDAPRGAHRLEEIISRCGLRQLEADGLGSGPHPFMRFGPRWQGLVRRVHVGENESLLLLELPEQFSSDLEGVHIHPSLLDAAVGFSHAFGETNSYLPLGYEKLSVKAPFTRRIYSHVKYKENDAGESGVLVCDAVIMDEGGAELLEIEGYTLKRVGEQELKGFALPAAPPAHGNGSRANGHHADGAKAGDVGGRESSAGESFTKSGIRPPEGCEVFARLLPQVGLRPQSLVSTTDFGAVFERARSFTRASLIEELEKLQARGTLHSRPNLPTAYVAPRTELERQVVGLWQETLGIEQVGVYDSFFELGGESLLATQLITRLGEAFGVDLPLRTLFKSPTAADLAVVILSAQAERADAGALAEALAEIQGLSAEELRASLAAEQLEQERVDG